MRCALVTGVQTCALPISKFLADPQRYIGSSVSSDRVAEGTIWTCPLHPEIWQDHLGACPICGMTIEPATVSAESGPSNELVDMTRRFWIGLILALPVFILEMGGHLFRPEERRVGKQCVRTCRYR